MRWGWPAPLAGLALVLAATSSGAVDVRLEPSETVACLTSTRGPGAVPDYPFLALKRQRPGSVRTQLRFDAPDQAPRVQILAREGAPEDIDAFEQAVREHTETLRLPCMSSAQAPVQIRQRFDFNPTAGRAVSEDPSDVADLARQQQLACLAHPSGDKHPDYPRKARQLGLQGRVLARYRFETPDGPPQIETLAHPRARVLERAVLAWAPDLRLPCLQGGPLNLTVVYEFVFADGAYGLKPVTLIDLLPAVRGLDSQALAFDTTAMACPFDLEFRYLQPLDRNRVRQMGTPSPSRKPLQDWLAGVELTEWLSFRGEAYFADTTTITVPCVRINLKPKE